MNRGALFAVGAAVGAAAAVALRRRSQSAARWEPAPDPRAEELRRKLAEARTSRADEDDFQAAGQGAETVVEEPPRRDEPPRRPFSGAPGAEFEAMRRRIHEEGQAAAEEMRREDAS